MSLSFVYRNLSTKSSSLKEIWYVPRDCKISYLTYVSSVSKICDEYKIFWLCVRVGKSHGEQAQWDDGQGKSIHSRTADQLHGAYRHAHLQVCTQQNAVKSALPAPDQGHRWNLHQNRNFALYFSHTSIVSTAYHQSGVVFSWLAIDFRVVLLQPNFGHFLNSNKFKKVLIELD